MVRGAHNSGVLGHPSPLLGSLWLIHFSPVVRGQHCGLAVLADGGHWLLVNALLCMVLIDGVVFAFLFSLIFLLYISFSMEERGSGVNGVA